MGWFRYMSSELYAAEFYGAEGVPYSDDGWLHEILAMSTREQLILALTAALQVAGGGLHGINAWQEYVLSRVPPTLAACMRDALDSRDGGPPIQFLARQPLLLALRHVLTTTPHPAPGDLDPRIAATLLSHHVALGDSAPPGHAPADDIEDDTDNTLVGGNVAEPLFGGRPESQTMSMVTNNLFNAPLNYGDLIARTQAIWARYEKDLARYPPRVPLRQMVREASGMELDDILALAFGLFAHASTIEVESQSVAIDVVGLGLPLDTVGNFLDRFSSTADELSATFSNAAPDPGEWFFLPFEDKPLLRTGRTEVAVIDVRLLQRRFTHALYWLVHDYEKRVHGDKARSKWAQTYSELVELHAEHLLRLHAPALLDGSSTFFTEEEVGKLGGSAADCGIDFGDFVLVADIVQHNVTLPARAYSNIASFKDDIAKSVLGKARQLDGTIQKLLSEVANPNHPLGRRPDRVVPMVVEGADFPVIPETTRYIRDQLAESDHLQQLECTRLLVVTLAELEMLASLVHAGHVPSADHAIRSFADDRTGDSFTNHLLRAYRVRGGVARAPALALDQTDALTQVLARLKTTAR
jgi:hypothetical protein